MWNSNPPAMVLEIPFLEWQKLSHLERRKLVNKEKKRMERIKVALEREAEEKVNEEYENTSEYLEKQAIIDRDRQREEAERQLQLEAWKKREKTSHEEFQQKKDREERKLKEREERERLIREEWEAIERKEKEEKERRENARQNKEALLEEALLAIDQSLESSENTLLEEKPWHNPFASVDEKDTRVGEDISLNVVSKDGNNFGTEKDTVNCPFYLKTGACRFGDRCSRHHPIPSASTTLLIRGMYSHVMLTQQMLDERDQDIALEHDENDMYEHYNEFYEDVFPEFAECGKVVQFKVSHNFEPHLRGNVYVQFSKEEECAAAFKVFNGRWYAGKQLSCEFCPVQRWRTAICGLYNRRKCPKGKNCNFLHVFQNPGGRFNLTDRDYPSEISRNTSPHRGFHRRHSNRSDSRGRSRSRSKSPEWSGHRNNRSYSFKERMNRRRDRSFSPGTKRSRFDKYSPDREKRGSYSSATRRESFWRRKQKYSQSPSSDRERIYSPDSRRDRSRSPTYRRKESKSSSERDSYYSSDEERKKSRKKRKRKRSSSVDSKRKRSFYERDSSDGEGSSLEEDSMEKKSKSRHKKHRHHHKKHKHSTKKVKRQRAEKDEELVDDRMSDRQMARERTGSEEGKATIVDLKEEMLGKEVQHDKEEESGDKKEKQDE